MKLLALCLLAAPLGAATYDVRAYGAKGDGQVSDTASINRAIEAATAAGGGVVVITPGRYLAGSVRLKSNVTLRLESGAVLEAASDAAAYDAAEPNASDKFQDFGHSHWHNSLLWGEGLENVTIEGGGLIHGKGLVRETRSGAGNKAIALKLCRNVTIRDIAILAGGHFAVLATGVDNLTLDNLRIDTNREGLDIDACRNVRISNCSVNAPNDDAIVLKSSYALGFNRATEQVTIVNCFVSGYDVGSLLDATYRRTLTRAPDRDGLTGRVKLGTESNGGFRNIAISNVVFEHSRGLALETVDGGPLEDVVVSNLTMRDVSNSPIFLRLGSRMRAPEGTPAGVLRRVSISHVVVYDADPRYPSIIAGIPGHDVEDVTLSDIRIVARGGITMEQVARQPAELVNAFFFRPGGPQPREPYATPERERDYPEPAMFGLLPAHGFFIRHARGIVLHNVQVSTAKEDGRPAFVLEYVRDARFSMVEAAGAPVLVLRDVERVRVQGSSSLADATVEKATRKEM